MAGREKRVRGGGAASAPAERSHTRIVNRQSPIANPDGFTLIELLVVISIVALLMAVLLPVLGRVRKQARATACQVTLRQWATTLALYVDDYQGRFPNEDYATVWMLTARSLHFPGDRSTIDFSNEANGVSDYHPIRTEGMLCPMATKPGSRANYGGKVITSLATWEFKMTYDSTFDAWVLTKPEPTLRVSYGLNQWLFDAPPTDGTLRGPETNVYSLRNAGAIPLLLDCRKHTAPPKDTSSPPEYEDVFPVTQMVPFCINRHDGYINCLFLDWSVRKVGLKELWKLKWHKDFDTGGVWTRAGGVAPEDWPSWMRQFKEY